MKIQLGRELTQRFERYAAITNQPVADVIRLALTDWMDTVGEGDIEVITGVPMDTEAQVLADADRTAARTDAAAKLSRYV